MALWSINNSIFGERVSGIGIFLLTFMAFRMTIDRLSYYSYSSRGQAIMDELGPEDLDKQIQEYEALLEKIRNEKAEEEQPKEANNYGNVVTR